MFETLKDRVAQAIDEDIYKQYSVMVPLIRKEDGIHVLFEQRASRLKRQPGEICFPGGGRDPGETPLENAVRETMEELLVERGQIHVIAEMDYMLTVYQNKISVFMCELSDYEMQFSEAEVARVFTVPLRFFLNTRTATISPMMGMTVMVIRRPTFALSATVAAKSTAWSASVTSSELRLLMDRQMAAVNAAIPEASFTTKVCMEKITDSSRRPFFNSP